MLAIASPKRELGSRSEAREKEIKIDREDFDLFKSLSWHIGSNGYVRHSTYDGKTNSCIYFHRLIMGFPENKQIDHINGNKLDNRKLNLRICTNQENSQNRKINDNSGVTYFRWGKRIKRWVAQITINGRHKNLGYFLTKQEANKCYLQCRKKQFGEFGGYKC